jgi:hypothetical protein
MADASFTFPKGIFKNYSVVFESLPASIKFISDDKSIDIVEFTIKPGTEKADFFDKLMDIRLDICEKENFYTAITNGGISYNFHK